jgi:hypothetical protein
MQTKQRSSRFITAAVIAMCAVAAICASACSLAGEWAQFTVDAVKARLEGPSGNTKMTVTDLTHRRKVTFQGGNCYIGRYSTREGKWTALGLGVSRIQGCA